MNKEDTRITVLVADDHALIRQGVKAVLGLTEDIVVVAEASNGQEAVTAWEQHRPQVAIFDARMPVLDGPSAIRRILEREPTARIIALSHYEGDEDIQRCLDAGAWTYLLKRSVDDELPDMVRATHRGDRRLPEDVKARLAFRRKQPHITEREREVLGLLVRGRTNKEIATVLDVSVNTINTHIATILQKLGAADRTEAATIALQRGIVHLD